ncbi:MAG TPA: helix-turn-helix domain-containing protein [Gemmataceae bacterium]|jgi:DNA-binding HxlR family transcriptional regulator
MATAAGTKRAQRAYHCPVEAALDVIGGKWKIVILCRLKQGTHRFGQLRRLIPGVSERMLTQHLRELERDGVVRRRVYAEVPPRVEYSLTPFGLTLRPVLGTLYRWGETHLKRIEGR